MELRHESHLAVTSTCWKYHFLNLSASISCQQAQLKLVIPEGYIYAPLKSCQSRLGRPVQSSTGCHTCLSCGSPSDRPAATTQLKNQRASIVPDTLAACLDTPATSQSAGCSLDCSAGTHSSSSPMLFSCRQLRISEYICAAACTHNRTHIVRLHCPLQSSLHLNTALSCS